MYVNYLAPVTDLPQKPTVWAATPREAGWICWIGKCMGHFVSHGYFNCQRANQTVSWGFWTEANVPTCDKKNLFGVLSLCPGPGIPLLPHFHTRSGPKKMEQNFQDGLAGLFPSISRCPTFFEILWGLPKTVLGLFPAAQLPWEFPKLVRIHACMPSTWTVLGKEIGAGQGGGSNCHPCERSAKVMGEIWWSHDPNVSTIEGRK